MSRKTIKNTLIYLGSVVLTLLLTSIMFYANDSLLGPIGMTRAMPQVPFLYIFATSDLHQYFWWKHTLAAIIVSCVFILFFSSKRLTILYGATISFFYATLAFIAATKSDQILWHQVIGYIITAIVIILNAWIQSEKKDKL